MDLEALKRVIGPLFPGLMGIELLEATPDRVRAEMPVRPDLCTTGGTLHGGAMMAFADTLGAIGTVLNLPAAHGTTTTSSATSFIAGAKAGSTVQAESLPLHRGRTTMVWQTTIRTEDGRTCAVVTQTQLVLAPRG
jgi:uncharacterized protein (TIGR00369 family)